MQKLFYNVNIFEITAFHKNFQFRIFWKLNFSLEKKCIQKVNFLKKFLHIFHSYFIARGIKTYELFMTFFFFIFNMYRQDGKPGFIESIITLFGLFLTLPLLLIQCLESVMPIFLLLIGLLIINIIVVTILILKSMSAQAIFITSLLLLFGYIYITNR